MQKRVKVLESDQSTARRLFQNDDEVSVLNRRLQKSVHENQLLKDELADLKNRYQEK